MRPCLRVLLLAVAAPFLANSIFAGEGATVFDIPKLADVKLDGDAAEWAGKGLIVTGLKPAEGAARTAPNFAANFKIGWDERGVLVLVQVTDDVASEPALKLEEIWKGDSIEAFVCADPGKTKAYQMVLAPGRGGEKKELRNNLSDYRNDFRGRLAIEAQRTVSDTGYTVEILFPWKNLGVEAKPGMELGLQLFANDVDEGETRYQAMWFPKPDAHLDSVNMQRLKLVEGAVSAEPVKAEK